VIKDFRHKGLKKFYLTGTRVGIKPSHAPRLARQLARLNSAAAPMDMNIPGWNLHPLKGDLAEKWAVSVNGNWRLIFKFENGDTFGIDYDDYH